MKKVKVLALLPDPLKAYDAKGYSRKERHDYYNPNREFDVSLVEFGEENKQSYKFAGFTVYPSDKNLLGLKEIVEKTQPDLVRAYNGTWGAELAGKIGKEYRIPSVISVHNLFPEKEITLIDKTICVSESVKQKCLEKGALAEKLVVINDGVDFSLFKNSENHPITQKLNNQYQGDYKIISVGRLTWQKNLEKLVEASNLANKELHNLTHLHIGNLGQLKEKITSKIKNSKHIHLLPNTIQKTLPFYYSWADAFTMASVSEGLGLVYIEALACGTPVIPSDLPPMNLYVKDKYNGLLINPESPEDIAEKICEILLNKSLHKKLQLNSRKSVEKFDIKKLKKQEAKLYNEMLR